jgi:hypothetical protein
LTLRFDLSESGVLLFYFLYVSLLAKKCIFFSEFFNFSYRYVSPSWRLPFLYLPVLLFISFRVKRNEPKKHAPQCWPAAPLRAFGFSGRCGTRYRSDSPRAIPENPAVLGNTKGVDLPLAEIK